MHFTKVGAPIFESDSNVRLGEKMDKLKKIAVLDNLVQAQMLESMLKEHDIPHVMKTYNDSAYDGLYQGPKGWGHVEAPEQHEAGILALLDNLKAEGIQDTQ